MKPIRNLLSIDNREAGVRFDVMLLRGAERRLVPTSYDLVSGDKMLFQFVLNRDACVYVLTRTIPGDGAAAERFAGCKGIEILRGDDLKAEQPKGEYRLLFPLRKTGLQNRLTAGVVHIVPGNGARFTMDQQPGIEKLYIVLSPTPVDILRFLDKETGRMLRTRSSAPLPDRGALTELGGQMSEWSKNGNTAIPERGSKGITVERYGVSADSARPALIEVDLRHRRP